MDREFQPWSSARMNTKFGFVSSADSKAPTSPIDRYALSAVVEVFRRFIKRDY